MINVLFSRICVLTCGTLYPGYASFKAVRAKSVDEYIKWMMFWVVFAIFTAAETFTDIFLTWFPFYYELKVLLIVWILPNMGNGSSFIYKQCIHPLLKKHETRVDHHLEHVREKGRDLVLHYMSEAVLYVGRSVMNVINKNFPNGVMGLLTNTCVNDRRIEGSNNIVIEEVLEEHEPQFTIQNTTTTTRKYSTKNSAKNATESHNTRGRKARHSRQDVDFNLNDN